MRSKLATLMASVVFLGFSCSTTKEVPLLSTSDTPAARGTVTAKSDGKGNNQVEVKVQHLAEASVVAPGANAYVVWVQPSVGDPRPQNMGLLKIDKNLKGSLKTTVPYDNFVLFVSAEPSGEVTSPSGTKILSVERSIEVSR